MSVAQPGRSIVTPGYSGKPLWQKLGLKPGLRLWLRHAPEDYWALCGFDADAVTVATPGTRRFNFGHVFATSRAALSQELPTAARKLEPGGTLWISRPKKSSGVATDVSEHNLREMALPLGLVDVKVCAVTEVWSGLKFVWRQVQR